MPFSCSKGTANDNGKKMNKEIDKKLKKDKKAFKMTHKIPVVGAGESGKSTLLKQMQILYMSGFTDEERRSKVRDIRGNIKDGLLAVTGAMKIIKPPVELEDSSLQPLLDYIQENAVKPDFQYSDTFFNYSKRLWADKGVQATFSRSNEYQLIDSAKYFLDRVDNVAREDFLPDDQDILRCRVLTSGIYETTFSMNKVFFHMFDVGGQRDERKKWIQVFSDVTAVIFVSACSGYDMTLRESQKDNRLRESIKLFAEVWNNRYLNQTSIIVFLNKEDLFIQKIKSGNTRLSDFFPEFLEYQKNYVANGDITEDGIDVTQAKGFIRDRFLAQARNDNHSPRQCYHHFTTAVNTENIKRVFSDCQNMLQRIYMQKMSLL